MKKQLFAALALIAIILPVTIPSLVFATSAVHSNVWDPASVLAGPLVTCTGNYTGSSGSNIPTCTSLCDLIATFENVIYFGITLVIWVFAPVLFAIGGINFMMSQGSPEKLGSAKKLLTGTLIGVGIVLCAYLIVSIFVNVLGIAGQVGGFGGSLCPASASVSTAAATSAPTPSSPSTPSNTVTASVATGELNSAGVVINSGASVAGMQQATINEVDSLATQCAQAEGTNCSVVITSGTDGTHAGGQCSHANGYKADIRSSDASLNTFITSQPPLGIRSDGAPQYSFDGGIIADERSLPGVAPHWDLSAPC